MVAGAVIFKTLSAGQQIIHKALCLCKGLSCVFSLITLESCVIKMICEEGATVGELRPSVFPRHVLSSRSRVTPR